MENMDKRKFRNGMIIYLLILIVAFILINRWMQSDKIEVTMHGRGDAESASGKIF